MVLLRLCGNAHTLRKIEENAPLFLGEKFTRGWREETIKFFKKRRRYKVELIKISQ